jgi:hypothetical protein
VPLFSNWSSLNHWLNFLPFGKPENNMKDWLRFLSLWLACLVKQVSPQYSHCSIPIWNPGRNTILLIHYSNTGSHFIDLAQNKILLIVDKGGHSDCPMETIC